MIQRKLNLGKVPISEIFYINEQFKQHTLLSEFKQHSWSYPSFYSSYLQVSAHSYLCLSTIIIWLFNSLFIINLSRTISRIFEFFYIILFILQKKTKFDNFKVHLRILWRVRYGGLSILVLNTVNNVLFGIKSNGRVVRPVYNLK